MKIEWLTAGCAVICLIVLGAIAYAWTKYEDSTGEEKLTEGKPDTVFVAGLADTVFLTKWNTKVVKVTELKRFDDSSKVDTVVTSGGDTLRLGITTYPEADSLRIETEWQSTIREIIRVDTLRLFRVDTLFKLSKVEVPATIPFYEDGWFYSTVGAVGIIALLILGGK